MSIDTANLVGLEDVPGSVRRHAELVMRHVAEDPRRGKKLIRPSKVAGRPIFWARVGRDHRVVYELSAGCVRFMRLLSRRDARRVGLDR